MNKNQKIGQIHRYKSKRVVKRCWQQMNRNLIMDDSEGNIIFGHSHKNILLEINLMYSQRTYIKD
jgi:hypothetical protein